MRISGGLLSIKYSHNHKSLFNIPRRLSLRFSQCPQSWVQYLEESSLRQTKLLHSHFLRSGFKGPTAFYNKLLCVYGRHLQLNDARKLFNGIPQKNVASWTTMIGIHAKNGNGNGALFCFSEMKRSGIQPDQVVFASLIPACASRVLLQHGRIIHGELLKRGIGSSEYVTTAFINMYAKCASVGEARQVFDEMSVKNTVAWTSMIDGYSQNGLMDEAFRLFELIPHRDMVVWNVMIAGCARNGIVEEALQLFEKIQNPNIPVWNSMLSCLAHNGRASDALHLFRRIPLKNVVSWSAIIEGLVQNGYPDEATGLFREMVYSHVEPNSVTLSNVLSACADRAVLQQGTEAHAYVIRRGLHSQIFVSNSVIDMYCKCGSVLSGAQVFERMPSRDVISWTAMIAGYGFHGYGSAALKLFDEMEILGKRPDHVVFVAVLSACNHSGLVDEGWYYFQRMQNFYKMEPGMKHYACMVDLLGRAGQLDEAYDLISRMPMKPNSVIWASLLAACSVHSNIVLGETVAEYLFELEPMNSAHYLALTSIYASTERWDDVERIRKLMRDRNVIVMTGISWTLVQNRAHEFRAGDRDHIQSAEIYKKLDDLYQELWFEGLVPVKNLLLDDVGEDQGEEILSYHSEKLAVAFSLISTSPGTPILIFKNLRVCRDCHLFTKLVSKIEQREIVMRDANRFHRFWDGRCSCGDYW